MVDHILIVRWDRTMTPRADLNERMVDQVQIPTVRWDRTMTPPVESFPTSRLVTLIPITFTVSRRNEVNEVGSRLWLWTNLVLPHRWPCNEIDREMRHCCTAGAPCGCCQDKTRQSANLIGSSAHRGLCIKTCHCCAVYCFPRHRSYNKNISNFFEKIDPFFNFHEMHLKNLEFAFFSTLKNNQKIRTEDLNQSFPAAGAWCGCSMQWQALSRSRLTWRPAGAKEPGYTTSHLLQTFGLLCWVSALADWLESKRMLHQVILMDWCCLTVDHVHLQASMC